MRTLLSTAAILVLACAVLVMAGDADKPWFDTKTCVFCKEIAAQPGLAEHMRHEYHNISAGVISVTYVDKEFMDEFENAKAGMKKVASSISPTNMPPMCQHCSKIGEFYMKGVSMEEVKSSEAVVVVYSHSDPEVIKEIQAFGARCNDELAKMTQKM